MDHSLYGYMSRRTNKELDQALNFCLSQADPTLYQDSIRTILSVLWEQEKDHIPSPSPELLALWEEIQKRYHAEEP